MIFGVLIAISTIGISAGLYIAVAMLFGVYCGVLISCGVAAEGIRRFLMHVISYRIAKERYVKSLLNGELDDEEKEEHELSFDVDDEDDEEEDEDDQEE